MRIGFNPNKDKELDSTDFIHQVVVPVFIPNHEDYFKDSFRILKYCLESLFKTSHNKTFFTIINNGSDKIVVDYLNNLLADGTIHELIHTTNIGKLNAILKGITGQKFQLITISDADVLFLNDWQKLVTQKNMPMAIATKWNKALNFSDFAQMFEYLLSDLICVKLNQQVKNHDLDFTVLSEQYSLEFLFGIYADLQQSKQFIEQNVQSNLVLDQLCIKLMNI